MREVVDEDLAFAPGSAVMSGLTVRVEQAMLGAVLADPAAQQHVLDLVEPADLQRPWHAQVLAAMRRVQKSGGLPGPAEVYAELRCDPDLPGSVSADAVPLVDLMQASPRAAHAPTYAAIVVESGIRRRLDLAGSRLAQAAESGDLDAVHQQAAHARRELGACRARWRALPEHLRRELSFISPNEQAVAAVVRHVPVAGAGIDRGRQGLVAESGPLLEDRDGQLHRHLAATLAHGAGVREQGPGHRPAPARPQGAAAELAGARTTERTRTRRRAGGEVSQISVMFCTTQRTVAASIHLSSA